jgi:Reverse transcriptase (RNA-dependent DNA polymerase)
MDANDIRIALLSKGYFPKELPATFTTESFGAASKEILKDWESAKVFRRVQKKKNKTKYKSNAYGYELPKAEMEIISTPKSGFERRNIGITHPIPQALLASEISDNYGTIQKWLCRQTYSLDEIRVSSSNRRAIKGINFSLHGAKKAYTEATSDWLVKTDITRFYPSIYTHSLTWAAYGKEKVKSKLKTYDGSLADRLDILTRACNRNQTIGIPIGPETSRVLAEIISSRIDDDLKSEFREISPDQIDRLQDDWFIGVSTLEEAEQVLSKVARAYREYGLDINGSKTSVVRVVQHLDEAWKAELAAFLSHRSGDLKGARLREFLSLTLRLQTEHERQSVTNYALTVLEGQELQKSDVEAMESFLLKATVVAPGSMARVSELLLNIDHDSGSLSKRRIGSRFIKLATRALEKGDLYEAIWLTYTLRGLKIPISDKNFLSIAGATRSSALALILLDMRSRGQIKTLPTAEWERQIRSEAILTDWTWLLAYEACRRGWLPDPAGLLNKPFFKAMNSRSVIFYDERRNVPKRAKMAKLRRAQRSKMRQEVQQFFFAVRNVDFDDDY